MYSIYVYKRIYINICDVHLPDPGRSQIPAVSQAEKAEGNGVYLEPATRTEPPSKNERALE